MHEFSLAKSVFDTVIDVAQKNQSTSIKQIILKFGVFALIQEDQFRFCFDLLKKEYPLTAKAKLIIKWIPGELTCLSCGFRGMIKSNPQNRTDLAPIFECPQCQKYTTEIISGTETLIDSIIV